MYTQKVELDKIRLLSKRYRSSKPSERKMTKRREEYKKDHKLHIIIREGTYELLEGYTYYTLAKELKLKFVECSIASKNEKFISAANVNEGIKLKNELFEKSNYKCYICNETVVLSGIEDELNFGTIDHFIPRSKGGANNLKNLRCCCRFCNNTKADRELTPELIIYIKKEKENAKKLKINTVSSYSLYKKGQEYKKEVM